MSKRMFFLFTAALLLMSLRASADGIMEVTTQSYPGNFLQLVRTEATVEIIDQVVITTIENTFNNAADFDIDVKYHFPAPNSASITGFGEYIGSTLHLWGLQPGQGGGGGGTSNPSLEEYLGENPFTIVMQDIPPGEKTIYLQFTGLLDYSYGDIIFEYPLWTPNYFSSGVVEDVDIDLFVSSQRIIDNFSCNYAGSIAIGYQSNDSIAVFLNYNATPPEDFEFEYTVSQDDIGAWLLTHVEADTIPDSDNGYFLLICEPGELQVGGVVQKYFTFILDKSGSMIGNKMTQAKAAAEACITMLDTADYFNVIDFSTTVSMFSQESLQATTANVDSAIDYINAISASGGTNIYEALMSGIGQQMGQNSANQIIFLTEGGTNLWHIQCLHNYQ